MRLESIKTPALILDLDLFEKNVRIMKSFIESAGLVLRPHYKSNKCTEIARMQIASGAKGITCAKLSEAEDLVDAGIEDVLIANQIVDVTKLARVAHLSKCCYLTICVDSAENIDALEAAAAIENSTIHCLIEYEIGMNRCGVKTPEHFCELAKKISLCPHLSFEGIQAYAGHLSHEENFEVRKAESEKVEQRLFELYHYAESKGHKIKEVSGASTGTVEFRNKGSVYTEIQAGSYIFMDTAYNALGLIFTNSLFVLSEVISVNNQYMITDAGRKSISVDQKMPVFKDFPHLDVRISEEHCTIPSAGINASIGDKFFIIPGHCCTTVNLHDAIYMIRQNKVINRVPITSRGKSI